jgi:hypothetical protein
MQVFVFFVSLCFAFISGHLRLSAVKQIRRVRIQKPQQLT